ncbi:MAG: hypothetical protein ACOYMG_27720 [Candidatus Methylumidiphilus sp.]
MGFGLGDGDNPSVQAPAGDFVHFPEDRIRVLAGEEFHQHIAGQAARPSILDQRVAGQRLFQVGFEFVGAVQALHMQAGPARTCGMDNGNYRGRIDLGGGVGHGLRVTGQ